MIYKQIYNNMENLLDSEKQMERLMELIEKLANGDSFYELLVKANGTKNNGIDGAEKDKFIVDNFNRWKNQLTTITTEELEQLKKQGSYDETIDDLKDYLSMIPDITTIDEYNYILNASQGFPNLENAFYKYNWDSIGMFTGWKHIVSRYIHAKRSKNINVMHRLYLNIDSRDIHKVAGEFQKKCEERGIDYYFKFDEFFDRDDNFVVYADTEKLPLYIELIKEIAKENPKIKERMGKPAFLSGKINEYIGYGSEPTEKNGQKRSYNSVRSKCLEEAAKRTLNNWYKNNRNCQFLLNGQRMSMIDFLAICQTKGRLEKLNKILERRSNLSDKEQKKALGYNQEYIDNPEFKKRLAGAYRQVIHNYLEKDESYPSKVEISTSNGKNIVVDTYDVKNILCLLAPHVYSYDAEFRKNIKEEIRKSAAEEDIDVDKFCFDEHTKRQFMMYDESLEVIKDSYEKICEKVNKYGFENPRLKKDNETIYEYHNYLKEFVKDAKQKVKEQKQSESTKQTSTREPATRSKYAMTDEEIRQSQIKLGFINPKNSSTEKPKTYRKK